MFNLLPEALKEILGSQYKKRRTIVSLWVGIITVLFIYIALLPSYLHVYIDARDIENELAVHKQSQSFKDVDAMVQVVDKTNKDLSLLNDVKSSVSVTTILESLITEKGPDISFTDIAFTAKTATTSLITLRGVATDRDALVQLSRTLKGDPQFAEVNVPVSNFVKDKNIEFNVTVVARNQ